MRRIQRRQGLVWVLAGSTACYTGLGSGPDHQRETLGADDDGGDGDDDDDDRDPGDSDDGDDGPADVSCDDSPFSISAAPLRRMTQVQHRYTLEDLLGASPALDDAMTRIDGLLDDLAGPFATNTTAPDLETTRAFLFMAEDIADVVASQPGVLPDCDLGDAGCFEPFIEDFGRRAYRRPLHADERARYLELWTAQTSLHDGATGAAATVSAMLSSPSFLYLEEPVVEGDGEHLELDQYALASRLSYFLWQSTPDAELLDVAASGTLHDTDVLADQVDRMLADARFDRALTEFHTRLVGLDRLLSALPSSELWSEALRAAMVEETGAFARHVFRESTGTVGELLTADYTYGPQLLADVYGSTSDVDGRIALDATQRSGVLTQAGFLTLTQGVAPEVHRGKFVREVLLCEHVPEPGDDIELDPEVNRLETEPCRACHVYMDPIGNGFARYGEIGEFLHDPALDTVGEVRPLGPGLEGSFETIPDLGQLLAGSEQVERCFARQWSRFAMGRLEHPTEDRCAIEELGDEAVEGEGDLRSLLRSIATSQRFRVRRADAFAE